MTKFFILFFSILIYGCSIDNKVNVFSKTKNETQPVDMEEELFKEDKVLNKEFNSNIKIYLKDPFDLNSFDNNLVNNHKIQNIKGNLNEVSKFKLTKNEKFENLNSELLVMKDSGIIFFDGKGTIFRLSKDLKLIWKNNFYQKKEKKLSPSLNLAYQGNNLIVTDDLSNLYLINIKTGSLVWKKKNTSSFNSQIKIFKNNFFTIDYENVLRSYSIKNGDENWNYKSENALIKNNKKNSLVIDDGNIIFINEVGDVNAVDLKSGDLIWQTPTQNISILEDSFSFIYSNIVLDNENIYFSNNMKEFFSINKKNGLVIWKQNISSLVNPVIINNIIFTISKNGFLIIFDKEKGNILRSTNIMKIFKKQNKNQSHTGFIVGKDHIFVTLSTGYIIKVSVINGKPLNVYKTNRGYISKPYVHDKHLYIVSDKFIKKFD